MRVLINTKKEKGKIPAEIYGHFSEHLGRCIYGGIWVGENSKIPNVEGYRKDVLEAFKEISIPALRWPGGCFADEYHWKDGIGPRENRKKMVNTNWGGVVEDNSFGTHEFLRFCELLECKPYINGNVGSGSVQEMSEWIEYMTFAGESPLSALREKNGRKTPWKIPYFGVGNESWGCGGCMKPEHYADLYRRYQNFVRQYGTEKIFKIACGANADDYNWTEVLMKEASNFFDGLSLHYYTVSPDWTSRKTASEFDEKLWYDMLFNAAKIDEMISKHDAIMTKYDAEKRVALIVDEWGTWHKVEDGTNPGFLYQQNTIRDALVAGITLNIFNNHSDRVRMANIAQAANVLQAMVLTEGEKMIKTPTWNVFRMYKHHQNATLLESFVSTEKIGAGEKSVDCIGASASKKGQKIFVTLTNSDAKNSRKIKITLDGLEGKILAAEGLCLSGNDIHDMSTFEKPDCVQEKPLHVFASGEEVEAELFAHSVSKIEISI